MATSNNVTSNYVGKPAGDIITSAVKEADTLRLGLVTELSNVNYKTHLRKLQFTNGKTDYSCGFVPQGALVLSEKTIEPAKVMNAFQLCKEDFRQTWSEDSMGESASNPNAPADIIEAMQLEVLSKTASAIDDEIWSNAARQDGEIGTGLIKQFIDDAAIIKDGNGITAPGHSVSESTVQADIKLALAAIPVALRRRNDLVVAVSPDVFQAYNFKMISLGQANDGTSEEKQAKFGKYTLTEVNGLPDDTIVVYAKDNVVYAYGSSADFNEVSLVDEDEIGLLTGQVRGKMVYNGAPGYYNSEEIVYLDLTA
jgi:hypothetical protein